MCASHPPKVAMSIYYLICLSHKRRVQLKCMMVIKLFRVVWNPEVVVRKNARVGQDRSRPTFLRLTVERPRRRSSTSSLSLPNEKMCIRVNCFVLVATVAAGIAVFADDGSDRSDWFFNSTAASATLRPRKKMMSCKAGSYLTRLTAGSGEAIRVP